MKRFRLHFLTLYFSVLFHLSSLQPKCVARRIFVLLFGPPFRTLFFVVDFHGPFLFQSLKPVMQEREFSDSSARPSGFCIIQSNFYETAGRLGLAGSYSACQGSFSAGSGANLVNNGFTSASLRRPDLSVRQQGGERLRSDVSIRYAFSACRQCCFSRHWFSAIRSHVYQ